VTHAGTIALIGRPNAGKSTLVNALVGEKVAIVSDKPQTTRHRIVGVVTEARGQAVLLDLPGVHRPLHRMNAQMMHVLRDTLAEVDAVLQLFDAAQEPGAGEEFVLTLLERVEAPVVLVPTKLDLPGASERLSGRVAFYTGRRRYRAVAPVSALKGDGLEALRTACLAALPEGPPLLAAGVTTTQTERFFVTELIREAVLERVADELPFTSAVHLREFQEKETTRGPLLRLIVDIVVERESQKAIIVGRAGRMIRDIGSAARARIETLLGVRVYLDLQAKVRPGWREDVHFLAELEPFEAVLPSGEETP
jgi:GTP-binding protein Era